MVFSSPAFIFFFLPICLAAYYLARGSNIVLLAFSLIFYAWGEPLLITVMVGSIVLNYLFGRCLQCFRDRDSYRAGAIQVVGVAANLALLGIFKYSDFLISLANPVLRTLNFSPLPEPHILLPLGISFFTFQAMSYLIDIGRRNCDAQRDIIKFALFKALFPQLIAGPIVRYSELA